MNTKRVLDLLSVDMHGTKLNEVVPKLVRSAI